MTDTCRENRLAHDLEALAPIHDAMPVGVAVWTQDGRLARANPVFALLIGQGAGAPPDLLFEDLIGPGEGPRVVACIAELWAGRRNHFACDLACVAPDGRPLWLRATCVPVYGRSGAPEYVISQIVDFDGTERRVESRPAAATAAPPLEATVAPPPEATAAPPPEDGRPAGLVTRAELHRRLQEALVRASRSDALVAVLACDVDRLAAVNRTHGRAVGDAVLGAVGRRIGATLRGADLAARSGDDGFLVILEGPGGLDRVQRIAERMLAAIRRPIEVPAAVGGTAVVTVSASIGVVLAPAGTLDVDRLLDQADRALTRAKAGGRDRVEQFRHRRA